VKGLGCRVQGAGFEVERAGEAAPAARAGAWRAPGGDTDCAPPPSPAATFCAWSPLSFALSLSLLLSPPSPTKAGLERLIPAAVSWLPVHECLPPCAFQLKS